MPGGAVDVRRGPPPHGDHRRTRARWVGGLVVLVTLVAVLGPIGAFLAEGAAAEAAPSAPVSASTDPPARGRTMDPRVWEAPSDAEDTEDGGSSRPAYMGAPLFPSGAPYAGNFPDPSVTWDQGTGRYYAYGTSTGGVNVPVMVSSDATTWLTRADHGVANSFGMRNDALPDPAPPGWPWWTGDPSSPHPVWAPASVQLGSRWVLFYAIQADATGRHCLVYATAGRPDGPFTNPRSFFCADDPMGSIDPQPFIDRGGQVWLTWKDEGMPGVHRSRLRAHRIFLGDPTTVGVFWEPSTVLLEADGRWDGGVVENPSLTYLDDGRLTLVYSGNDWLSDAYGTGLADCVGLSARPDGGPVCTRQRVDRPWLNRMVGRSGIGGATAFRGPGGRLEVAYHFWDDRYPAGYPSYPACTRSPLGCLQQQRYFGVGQVYPLLGDLVVNGAPGPSAPAAPPAGFVPLPPKRVVDSRSGLGTSIPRRLSADEVVVVDLGDEVPSAATAATLNVTVTGPTAPGWVSLFPCGAPPPASTVNYVVDTTVPNSTTVRLNDDHEVCLYVRAPTHVVVDLQGAWVPGVDGWHGTSPTRVLDTRTTAGPVAAESVREVVVGVPGAPDDSTAVAVNLTADGAAAPGWFTAWNCDGPVPVASNVNYRPGAPSANSALVRVSARGTICVYSEAPSHLIVDVFGYAAAGGAGFEFATPLRVLDTREVAPYRGTSGVPGRTVVVLPLGATPGSSVTFNLTATGVAADGFVTVFGCAAPPATDRGTSSLNVVRGETRAANVTVTADGAGRICARATATMHLVVDRSGAT